MTISEPNCLSQLLKFATNTIKYYLRLGSVTQTSSPSSSNNKSTCKNKKRKKRKNKKSHPHRHRHHPIRSDDDLHIPSELASSDILSDDDDLYVPTELASDILARLPTKEVFRYQCVCKRWRDQISTAFFMKSHTLLNNKDTHNSSSYIILHTAYISLLSTSKSTWFCLDFGSPVRNKPRLTPLLRMPNILGFIAEAWDVSSLIVGSSNGLLCFRDSLDPENKPIRFRICNPATGSLSVTPYLNTHEHTDHHLHCRLLVGFGYDSTSHDYKILCLYAYSDDILHGGERFTNSWVYSSKTNSWKPIIPSLDYYKCLPTSLRWNSSRMVYSNNALHWINTSPHISTTISFDLATEKYDEIPMPPDFSPLDFFVRPRMELVGLRGRLHLVKLDRPVEEHMEIWVMKKYRVQWTKLVCIDLSARTFLRPSGQLAPPIPYAYTKDGKEILIGFGDSITAFVRCNLHSGKLKEIKVPGVQDERLCAMPFDCFSLVSSSPSD